MSRRPRLSDEDRALVMAIVRDRHGMETRRFELEQQIQELQSELMRLREQISAINDKALAEKFDVGISTMHNAIHGRAL